jgi:hypothetical protein
LYENCQTVENFNNKEEKCSDMIDVYQTNDDADINNFNSPHTNVILNYIQSNEILNYGKNYFTIREELVRNGLPNTF